MASFQSEEAQESLMGEGSDWGMRQESWTPGRTLKGLQPGLPALLLPLPLRRCDPPCLVYVSHILSNHIMVGHAPLFADAQRMAIPNSYAQFILTWGK